MTIRSVDGGHVQELRSEFRLCVASVGMTLVAVFCATAGLLYGFGDQPEWGAGIYVAMFGALVFPYFFSREASVEEPRESDRSNNAQFFSLVIFVLLAALAYSTLRSWGLPASQLYGTSSAFFTDGIVGIVTLALLPFIYLALRTWRLLHSTHEDAIRERLFKNRVLLPAFAACLVSFSFGWSISHPNSAGVCMVVPLGLIVGLKELGTWQRDTPLLHAVIIISVILSVAFGSILIFGSPIGKVVIIGVILTLAMGVAEVCKRVVRYRRRGFGPRVDHEDFRFYYAGSNWSSVLFPLMLCFLPLLIVELPILPIFIALSVQYIHWHYFFPAKNSRILSIFNIFLGFLLPALICIQYLWPWPPVLFRGEAIGDTIALLGIVIAAFALVISLTRFKQSAYFLENFLNLDTYEDYDNCYLFFIAVLFGLSGAIVLFELIVGFGVGLSEMRIKATEVLTYLLLLMVVATILYFRRRDGMRRAASELANFDKPGRDNPGHARSAVAEGRFTWILVWNVARLPVGVIAGSVVFVMIKTYTVTPWWMILLHASVLCMTTMVGFLLNDIFDVQKDRLGSTYKPVALGLISSEVAFGTAVVMACVTLALSASIAQGFSFYVVVAALVGVTLYSAVARFTPPLKGLATGALCCAPCAYGGVVCGVHFPILFYGFVFAFISGRELLLDVRDYPGDQKAGVQTLVAYLKPLRSRIVGWGLMFASVGVCVFYFNAMARILALCALLSLVLCSWVYSRNENAGLALSRITLLICAISGATSI